MRICLSVSKVEFGPELMLLLVGFLAALVAATRGGTARSATKKKHGGPSVAIGSLACVLGDIAEQIYSLYLIVNITLAGTLVHSLKSVKKTPFFATPF